jgi:hypothetical protein
MKHSDSYFDEEKAYKHIFSFQDLDVRPVFKTVNVV